MSVYSRRPRRSLRPELILMDLDGSPPLLGANHAAPRHQLQGTLAVQLRRPAYGQLQALAGKQVLFGAEQDAIAAHVDGLAEADLVNVFPVEDLVAHFPLDGKAIRSATIVFFSF